MPADPRQQLYELILAGDRYAATALVDEWAGEQGYERAVLDLLEPVLKLIGDRYASGDDLSLAQAYIVGKVAEDIMEKAAAARASERNEEALKGPVVMGNIEDDCHALGRKLVVTFLRSAGWHVHDLGNDVPPELFVDKALEVGAPIVGVSAMMYTTAMNIRKLRDEIDSRGVSDRIRLAVGGAVFVQRPELVAQVGGEGTATNALRAPELMTQLLEGPSPGGLVQ